MDQGSGRQNFSCSSKHAYLMIKDDSEARGEHVSEAIKHVWEQEAAGCATIERWVMVVTCDGCWRFNPCKNVPHLNPN